MSYASPRAVVSLYCAAILADCGELGSYFATTNIQISRVGKDRLTFGLSPGVGGGQVLLELL